MSAVWTAERKAKLAGWLKEGLSAGEIVSRLDVWVSRNAVIGIVARDARLNAIGFVRSRGKVGRRTIPNKPVKKSRLAPSPAVKPEPLPPRTVRSGTRSKIPDPRSPGADDGQRSIPSSDPAGAKSGGRTAAVGQAGDEPGLRFRQSGQAVTNHLPERPLGFLDAVENDRCLWALGGIDEPTGPDMPVCGGVRADVARSRWCAAHRERLRRGLSA